MFARGNPPGCGARSAKPNQARGFTLIEILLVLAVLVALAAIVVPTLGVFDNEYLRRAAEQVRGDWTKARVEAMTTGLIQVFRYQPESGDYVVQPWEGDDAALEVAATGSVSGGNSGTAAPGGFGAGSSPYAAPTGTGAGAAGLTSAGQEKKLPEDVKFLGGQVAAESRGASVSSALGGVELAQPILFYPDGTTSDAQLVLANEEGASITLDLRGLTGVVQVSPISYQDALTPTGPSQQAGGLP